MEERGGEGRGELDLSRLEQERVEWRRVESIGFTCIRREFKQRHYLPEFSLTQLIFRYEERISKCLGFS